MDLKPDEIEFLSKYGLTQKDVYDARYSPSDLWKERMRELNKSVALGVKCKYGHRLRTRSGHCIVCDPAKFGFWLRHRKPGYVYLAASKSAKLVKIGQSDDVQMRNASLNQYAYANASDWEMLTYFYIDASGKIESEIHGKLKAYQVYVDYFKGNEEQLAREAFACHPEKALQAINAVVDFGEVKECVLNENLSQILMNWPT